MDKKNTPLRNSKREIPIHILILFSQFDPLSVLFIERSNIESISSVNFTTWWGQRRCILLRIDLMPVDAGEEWMIFDFFGAEITKKRVD
jgi:hypothetical protein